jgi:hypothetical protein
MMSTVSARRDVTGGRGLLRVLVLAAVVLLAWCASAHADLVLEPGAAGFRFETSSDQAGAHADLTASFKFVTNGLEEPGASLRNVSVELPPGFVGAPAAVPTCNPSLLKSTAFVSNCPLDTQVGTTAIGLTILPGVAATIQVPVYNMTPSKKQTAVFGFYVGGVTTVYIVFSTRPHSYGITATTTNINGNVEISSDLLTVWGVPADPSHDVERGQICVTGVEGGVESEKSCEGGGQKSGQSPTPFLTNPTECTQEPLKAHLHVTSWEGYPNRVSASSMLDSMTGCERVSFDPTLSLRPTITQADSPTGYGVDLRVPQDNDGYGLASGGVRDASVTLPAGTALSPSAATGLVGCQPTGPEGISVDGGESEEVDLIGDVHPTRGRCPLASELGTVKIASPLVSEPFEGHLFLAQPQCGGAGQQECRPEDAMDGKLYGMYLEAEGDGVILKLKGSVSVDPTTGQITGTFRENPQAPFSDLHLEFFGGPRSPLVNPRVCGEAVATSQLTPFSSLTPAEPFTGFMVTGCPGPVFAPSFRAGSTSNQAGDYTPLSVTFSREDLEGELGQVTVSTPVGLLGMLSHVTLCGEPQAAQGTCAAASQIGEVTASAGAGPEPYYVSGGKVYITGPYAGAPYGLSIVEPAVAGPYNLGNVVVRGAIHVDPRTAALTITSEPLPRVKDGILLQIKTVHVDINRPEFVFNPTNCDPMSLTGTLASTNGMSSVSTNHFQVTNCGVLGFKPQFKVSTPGKTSRANGAGLDVKLSYPAGSFGKMANIAKVKVDLPKQLPSRLTTLQKACPDSVFNQNPAACPPGSKVGEATATTPVLTNSLSGPAYFVSHGGAKFPELVIVLSGEGVTVQLDGETFISKAGITSSTFRAIPDVPIGSFELKLPQGPDSALAANGNLCQATLKMPTAFTAQNGATIHESTPVTTTGCPKEKAKKAQVKSRAKKTKGKRK